MPLACLTLAGEEGVAGFDGWQVKLVLQLRHILVMTLMQWSKQQLQ